MSELSFEELLEESFKTVHVGEVVTGKVIDVKDDEIILNIGCKADGIISKHEYSNDSSVDLKEVVHIDDEMEAKVMKVNDGEGQILLSYKRLALDRVNKRLEEAFENEEILKAEVTQVVSGGLTVNVEGSRVFIPASLVSDVYERNLEKYNGQEIEFIITEFNPRKRRIIGNRKKIIAERKAVLKEELFSRIEEGMTVNGTVTNITDFGAFIDLGGADGLLHVSEMSWDRVSRPKNVFKVGQEVTCFIKEIKDDRIALSMKFPGENPWEKAAAKYAPGTIVTGRVARMTDFGAFIELEEGIDALLHVSQISRTRIEKPSDVLKIGEEIEAKVVDFNAETKRISLSKKALEPAPERAPKSTSRRKKEEPSNDFTDKVEANTMGSLIAAVMGADEQEAPALETPVAEEEVFSVETAAVDNEAAPAAEEVTEAAEETVETAEESAEAEEESAEAEEESTEAEGEAEVE